MNDPIFLSGFTTEEELRNNPKQQRGALKPCTKEEYDEMCKNQQIIKSSLFLKMSYGAIRISTIKAVRKYRYQDSYQIDIEYGVEEAYDEYFSTKKTRDKAYNIILRILDGDVTAIPELESVLASKDEEPEDAQADETQAYSVGNNPDKKSGFLSKIFSFSNKSE